ncbi:hypothetical protein [Burkholderia ubonensis]|uniref:Uncharacterized protein n=1 Tax=Burkholderia ubonensis subsp. mesacidophila TaxID=265293 RepID=A0A2A4FBT1_9BURK|nr:hypothetical protein [Burkholderia ubonensis]PCE30477.1 hypothetical protein BZL54_20580 [Burkholderia ubonensis subsp. mesacidophila]
MDLREIVLCLASILLASTTGIYGVKFLRRRNYLLGIEWLVVTVSASNALLFFATGSPFCYGVSHFLDAFSRGFGMPVIAVAGLMAVTHHYKPSVRQDVILFGVAVVGTTILMTTDFIDGILPYFYVVMWTLLALYLAYFVKRLLNAGQTFHALTTLVALVSSLAIAYIYDFYKIPGEEHNIVFNFYTLALLTWSYLVVSLSHAYWALEMASKPVMGETGISFVHQNRST